MLESLDLPLGVVLGTFGVERHRITWKGQAAHAGSTPMDARRDALAGAAKLALELRHIAERAGGGAVCTSGGVVCKPGIVTSVVETAEQLLDQRHLDADALASMLADAKACSERFAAEESIEVSFDKIWSIEPILFDPELVELCDEAILEVTRRRTGCRSGPLHDAAEVARAGVPTVMLFCRAFAASRTRSSRTRRRSTWSWPWTRSTGSRRRQSPGSRRLVFLMLSFGVTVLPDPPASRLVELMQLAESTASSTAGRTTRTSSGTSRTRC